MASSTDKNVSLDNIDAFIENLKKCKILREQDVIWMCSRGKEIFRQEPNIKQVFSPVTVCGDIHGQMYDLKELFIVGGDVPETNYLFMGDYVDRGMYSIETFLLLLALKIRYPTKITLLRGNHECRHVTMVFGFYDECLRKFGSATVWKHCTDLFDTLPLAATVDSQILCVHGGLSPTLNTLDEMKQIDRFTEVPTTGAMCDLLWSDPHDRENGWKRSPRGAGYTFGPDVTKEFIFTNGLNVVCRSHQLVNEGFRWYFGKMLLTVWSAPNYCYRCGNLAAIMELSEHLEQCFITFMAAPTALRGHLARRPPPQYFI